MNRHVPEHCTCACDESMKKLNERGRREKGKGKRERDKNLIKNSLTSKSPVDDNEFRTKLKEDERERKRKRVRGLER